MKKHVPNTFFIETASSAAADTGRNMKSVNTFMETTKHISQVKTPTQTRIHNVKYATGLNGYAINKNSFLLLEELTRRNILLKNV